MKRLPVWQRPKLWKSSLAGFFHCAGCHHPLVAKITCEIIEELGIEGNVIVITGVGCGFRDYLGFDFDGMCAPHGRAPDLATGIKRSLYGKPIVFTLQGDGDCIAIGAEPLINAAARAERITVIMVNNANYGTTGGQMAPTSLLGQITTTTPQGRQPDAGYPIHVAELLATIKGVVYSARTAVNSPANYRRSKKYLKAAFQKQIDNAGFSFVEVLSACPADWHLSPLDSLKWIEEKMMPEFPLGEFKNIDRID